MVLGVIEPDFPIVMVDNNCIIHYQQIYLLC